MLNGSYPHLKAFANDHVAQFETAWLTLGFPGAPLEGPLWMEPQKFLFS